MRQLDCLTKAGRAAQALEFMALRVPESLAATEACLCKRPHPVIEVIAHILRGSGAAVRTHAAELQEGLQIPGGAARSRLAVLPQQLQGRMLWLRRRGRRLGHVHRCRHEQVAVLQWRRRRLRRALLQQRKRTCDVHVTCMPVICWHVAGCCGSMRGLQQSEPARLMTYADIYMQVRAGASSDAKTSRMAESDLVTPWIDM